MKNRVELHAHSMYSLRDACMKITEYVAKVKELGMTACALTDHGNMFGTMEFYKACKKEGIKPIIGVEAYVIPTKEMAESDDPEKKHIKYHLTLLAKDNIGYQQIIKAVTESQLLKDKKAFPRMTYESMRRHFQGGHVIALSGCMNGELAAILLSWRDEKKKLDALKDSLYEEAKNKALFYQDIFGKGNYFIELQNHGIEEELYILPLLIRISRETGIMAVATNDVHYATKNDKKKRDMMVALRFGSTLDKIEQDCGELYLKSYEEMLPLFPEMPEAVSNSMKVAEMCEIEFVKEQHFPKFKTPTGYTEESYLRKLAEDGIYWRFPNFDSWKKEYKDLILNRLNRELETICKLQYAGYLLIVQDFIRYARKHALVGPGRGSAVGSLVCYLIGITNVNPLKYNLLFERFLNEDRVSQPDIDSDFDDFRDGVIDYVKKVYGENSVCNIVTYGTLGAKAAIRNAGRVTGKPLHLCDMVAKMIPSVPGIKISEALEQNPELKEMYDANSDVRELIDDALLIEGLVVQTGIHAAGVIIADRDVSDYIPLLYDEGKGMWVSQFDKDTCEADCGLLKMDFLGLENLTIIKRTLKDIEKNHGVKINLEDIKVEPEVIREIFQKGRTKAIFQFESSGMVNLLKRFQPESFEDLILLNAAYRPGPMQYIDDIIQVKQGKKKPAYIVSKMKDILDVTYGKPIYQEQIMSIFHIVGGFTLGESDIIRYAMSKKKMDKLQEYLPKFKEKLIKEGATPEDAEKFCEELIEFGKYAFNKSHSTAYAYLAYITAWLKYHYPVEYMANVLTSTDTKKLPVYIQECRNMGIPVLPPSVNESGKYFTPTKAGTIRFGLAGVKNVGKACDSIIHERQKNGEYKTLKEFIERLSETRAVYKQVIESLILTGAFDEFNLNRRQMMEGCMSYVADLKDYQKKLNNTKTKPQTLERARKKVEEPHFDVTLPEYQEDYILAKEKELIGFYASGHPLEKYRDLINDKADTLIGDIEPENDGKQVTLVGQITSVTKLHRKSDGAAMAKFRLEDLTGEVDVMAFTKTYAEYGSHIKEGEIVIVKGRVSAETDPDQPDKVYELQINSYEIHPATQNNQQVYIKIKSLFDWDKAKLVVEKYSGSSPLFIHLEYEDQLMKAPLSVKACQQLKQEFAETFGQGSIAIIT